MSEDKTGEKIALLREKESNQILKFLAMLAFLTFIVLVFLVGLLGKTRAWQIYFAAVFVLVVWLAFRLLESETEIEELLETDRKAFK